MKLTIPYYLHKAGAGFPSPATDYIEEDIDLNMHLIKMFQLLSSSGFKVNPWWMLELMMEIYWFDKSLKPKNFSTVIANVHDELVVKTLVQEEIKNFYRLDLKIFQTEF